MTHTTQVLSDERVAEVLTTSYGSPEWTMDDARAARAIESATLKAVSGKDDVKQRLFQLLNGAAGDGLIINEIDAAELFTDLFPEHIEFITRGAIPDATLPPAQPAPVDELIEALESLMDWQVKNVKCWNNRAYDHAHRVLKRRRAALQCAQAPQPTKGGQA